MGDEQIDFVGLYWVGLGVMFLGFLVPLGAMFAIGTLSTYPAFWLAKQVSGEGPEAARLATQLLWLTRILLIFPIGFASSRLLMRRRERFSPTSGQRFKAGCAAPI